MTLHTPKDIQLSNLFRPNPRDFLSISGRIVLLGGDASSGHRVHFSCSRWHRRPQKSLLYWSRTIAMTVDRDIPWKSIVPEPRCVSPASMDRSALLQMLREGKKPGIDFLLVDLRREDHEVRHHTSVQDYFPNHGTPPWSGETEGEANLLRVAPFKAHLTCPFRVSATAFLRCTDYAKLLG